MQLPNKITTFNERVISKFSPVLRALENQSMQSLQLYTTVKPYMDDVESFLEVLDCLYVLGKIDFNKQERTIYYVGNAD